MSPGDSSQETTKQASGQVQTPHSGIDSLARDTLHRDHLLHPLGKGKRNFKEKPQ